MKFGVDVLDICIEGLMLDSWEVNICLVFLVIKGYECDGWDFIF